MNKPTYENHQRVEVAIAGDVSFIVHGEIIGLATVHVIDQWIVLIDEKDREKIKQTYPFDATIVQHTFIRPEGSNLPFLCQTGSFTQDDPRYLQAIA